MWTIAFLSFQNHAKNSRDSVRVGDFFNIWKWLELFLVKVWKYPLPNDSQTVTYSWGLLWTQWSLWDWVIGNIWVLNKKPVDPFLWTEYTYSVINIRDEYQLGWISEAHQTAYNVINNANAASESYTAILKWNYNGKVLKTTTGGIDYVFALPSIVATDLDSNEIETIIGEDKLVYNNYYNIPSTYNESLDTGTWWFGYVTSQLIVYSWSVSDLSTSTWQIIFADNLQKAYSWTVLASHLGYREELSIDTAGQEELSKNVVKNYLNNSYGGLVIWWTYDLVVESGWWGSGGWWGWGGSSCVFWTSTFPCDL